MSNAWTFTIFMLFFCMTYTSIQRICQKVVWSIDHTSLNVAPPLRGGMAWGVGVPGHGEVGIVGIRSGRLAGAIFLIQWHCCI
jgi:hypothetical protein